MSTGDNDMADITDVEVLEAELLNIFQQQLPADRRAEAPDIAKRLAGAIDRAHSENKKVPELVPDESLSPAVKQSLVTFGERNKFRDVSIGDLIGGDQYLLNVNLIQKTARGRVFLPMPVPTYFVNRPEYSTRVKDLLRDNSAPAGATRVVAIHGLEGIGKSTLAASLIQDDDVQDWFKDGVLSATVGPDPDLLAMLNTWIYQLSGAVIPLENIRSATAELSTQVQHKTILLVLDDVQKVDHIQPFITGNELAPLLVTTRRADVVTAVGSDPYELAEMTVEQSLELVVRRMGRKLKPSERPIATELVSAVGCLPLALEMLAARMSRNPSWQELLKTLQEQIIQLGDIEDPRQRRAGKPKLEATLNVSLNALRGEDPAAWALFPWLSILRSDAAISAPMAATLWSVPVRDANDVLEILWNDALLLQGPILQIDGQTWSSYRLHSLLANNGRRILTSPQGPAEPSTSPGQGLKLEEAHAVLLDRYRASSKGGKWHTLADDGYVLSHLIWHLEQSKQPHEIHALLREDTDEGRNGWYEARGRLENMASYLQDVGYAWRLAEESTPPDVVPSQAIGLQCRYLLVTTSVRNLVQQIPRELLVQAVEAGLWPVERVLAYLRVTHDMRLLHLLANRLEQPQIQQMVPWALASIDVVERAVALSLIVPRLPEPDRTSLVPEAIASVEALYNSDDYRYQHTSDLEEALRRLGPIMSEAQLRESLGKWSTDKTELWTVAVDVLGPSMPASLAAEIWAKLSSEELDDAQLAALVGLLPNLPDSERDRVGQVILEGIRLHTIDIGASLLGRLAPELTESQLRDLLKLIEVDTELYYRSEGLAELISRLPDSLILDAERVVWSLYGRDEQVGPLMALMPRLTRLGERDRLRRALKVIKSRSRGVAAVSEVMVIPYLAPKARDLAIQKILESTLDIDSRYRRWSGHQTTMVNTLLAVGEQLRAKERYKLLQRALDITARVPGEWQKARVLESLAPVLPEALMEPAWQIARQIEDPDQRAYAMERLASSLSWEAGAAKHREALAEVPKMESNWWQAVVLARLARSLPEEQRNQVLNQALTAAETINDAVQRAQVSLRLASHLDSNTREQAVQQTVSDLRPLIEYWPLTLPNFARYLSAQDLAELVPATLSVVSGMRNKRHQAELMMALSPHVPGSLFEEGLKALQRLESEWDRAKVLARLAANLPKPLPPKVVSIASEMKSPSARARALIGLGACEEGPQREQLLQQALDAILGIKKSWRRVKMLNRVAPLLAQSEQLLRQALEVARKADSDWCTAGGLAVLIPYLPSELRQEALNEALASAESIKRLTVREGTYILLMPYLEEGLRASVLRNIFKRQGNRGQSVPFTNTLSKVLPYVPDPLLPELIEITSKFPDSGVMPRLVRALALRMPLSAGDARKAIKRATGMTDLSDRARALIELAPLLPSTEVEEVLRTGLKLIMQSGNLYATAFTLSDLAALLPKGLIEEALEAVRSSWDSKERVHSLALSRIAVRLAMLGELERAVRLLPEIVHADYRTWAIARIVPHMLPLPSTELYPLWITLLHCLGSNSRKGLLMNLVALAPLIVKLGGREAVKEIIDAIRDVGRWWA